MFPRETVVRRKGKTYRYTQLVESFRQASGTPSHRVVASLGQLSPQEFANLKAAFKASRDGKAVVVAGEAVRGLRRDKVKANLRYLDVAVIRQMWQSWGLGPTLRGLIGNEETTVPTSDVIEVLTLQRCVAPRSKLHAQEWFPTTALPELLGMPLRHFNNSRVHRALDALHKCTPQLQEKMTTLYQDRQAAFAAMFLDVTDTYFEGHGCESAKRSRTKAGHRNKWCIGIVLLANEQGFPLRWTVIPGRTKDHTAMAEMIGDIGELDWAQGVPLVCDRAMGQQTSVKELHDTGLHFLTAAHVDSIESYTGSLPWRAFSKAEIEGTEVSREKDVERVVECAEQVEGLEKVDDQLFVIDLGVLDWLPDASGEGEAPRGAKTPSRRRKRGTCGIQECLRNALRLKARIDGGEFRNIREMAGALGFSPSQGSQLLVPLRLPPRIQESILALKQDVPISRAQLQEMANMRDVHEQQKLFEKVLDACEHKVYPLRLAAYFNPQMFVDKRRRAQEHLDELHNFVAELNTELATAKRSRDEEPTRRKIVRRLEKRNYLDLFEVCLEPIPLRTGRGRSFRCDLRLRREAWERRHRYSGFVLLLAHPDLPQSAKKLALLYRAKDAVEKDFQCIKSVIKLRPIFHRRDPKVAAHVSLCMLALLLERTLEFQLAAANLKQTAARTIEQLSTCHLNLTKPGEGGACFYSVTEATRTQQRVLKALDSSCLVDDQAVARELTPRFVTT